MFSYYTIIGGQFMYTIGLLKKKVGDCYLKYFIKLNIVGIMCMYNKLFIDKLGFQVRIFSKPPLQFSDS